MHKGIPPSPPWGLPTAEGEIFISSSKNVKCSFTLTLRSSERDNTQRKWWFLCLYLLLPQQRVIRWTPADKTAQIGARYGYVSGRVLFSEEPGCDGGPHGKTTVSFWPVCWWGKRANDPRGPEKSELIHFSFFSSTIKHFFHLTSTLHCRGGHQNTASTLIIEHNSWET